MPAAVLAVGGIVNGLPEAMVWMRDSRQWSSPQLRKELGLVYEAPGNMHGYLHLQHHRADEGGADGGEALAGRERLALDEVGTVPSAKERAAWWAGCDGAWLALCAALFP